MKDKPLSISDIFALVGFFMGFGLILENDMRLQFLGLVVFRIVDLILYLI